VSYLKYLTFGLTMMVMGMGVTRRLKDKSKELFVVA
jgi:hypothetical protein